MKALIVGLLLMASSVSFADTTISGLVTKTADDHSFQVQEDGGDKLIPLDINFDGGSGCGQALAFEKAMELAAGHRAQLTGVFETASTGDEVFRVDRNGVIILDQ